MDGQQYTKPEMKMAPITTTTIQETKAVRKWYTTDRWKYKCTFVFSPLFFGIKENNQRLHQDTSPYININTNVIFVQCPFFYVNQHCTSLFTPFPTFSIRLPSVFHRAAVCACQFIRLLFIPSSFSLSASCGARYKRLHCIYYMMQFNFSPIHSALLLSRIFFHIDWIWRRDTHILSPFKL